MENFMELAQQRFSCRSYREDPVPPELVAKCLEAACAAPSACNSQPWKYYVVTDPEKRAAIADGMDAGKFNPFTRQAPVIVAVTEVAEPHVSPRVREMGLSHTFSYFDLGLSVAHLTLQAAELGLGSIILGLYPEETVREVTGMPREDQLRVLVLLGWPQNPQAPEKKRLPREETVRYI